MRRAIWMALAFMGTAPLVALAQQNTGAQAPAASPSGTTSIDRGQDTNAIDAPGAPGQQSAGTVGTAQGQPAGGAAPFGGTGGGGTAGTGGGAMGAGGGGAGVGAGGAGTGGGAGMTGGQTGTGAAGATSGPTYRGTGNDTPDIPSGSPPVDVGTQIGPEPGERAGNAGTGTVGAGGGGTGGAGQGGGTGGGQAAAQQAPLSGDAMQRELTTLRERVARLEGQVRDLGRGTGGAGTGGGGGTTDTSNVRAQGPTVVATVTFDGTVRAVSSNRIQVVDREDGSVYNMRIDRGTRVSDDGKAINPRQLSEGTPVRASLAFIAGEEHARDIVVIDEETQRLQQQQQRQQRQQRLEGMGPGQRLMQPDAPPRTPGGLPGSSTR